jgi:hypothetical protein
MIVMMLIVAAKQVFYAGREKFSGNVTSSPCQARRRFAIVRLPKKRRAKSTGCGRLIGKCLNGAKQKRS